MTHVDVDTSFTEPMAHTDLNGDGIGYVESFDFSRANLSLESRIASITAVASVCYQNPKALGSISLYDRLAAENKGLPSSSYEFVPVLLPLPEWEELILIDDFLEHSDIAHTVRYGEVVTDDDDSYLLTNLRALIHDVGGERSKGYLNTEAECEIISRHFRVFRSKIDLATARQFMRHRASWQELSRHYVSGKRSAFEFYQSPRIPNAMFSETIDTALESYDALIDAGVKPEEARRILPQSMYTTVWSAWQPSQLDILYKLRIDPHAQAAAGQPLCDVVNQLTIPGLPEQDVLPSGIWALSSWPPLLADPTVPDCRQLPELASEPQIVSRM